MSRLSFIAECVKNVDPRYFYPHHLSHDPKWYNHYQEFVIGMEDKCYEIRGDRVGKQYRHEGHETPFRL